jgi:hypothetical protein
MTAASSTTGATAAPMPSRSSSLSYSSMGGAANDDDNDSRHGRGRKGRGRCTPPAKAMTRRQSTMIVIAPLVVPFVVLAATAAISDAVVAVPPRGTRRRRRHHLRRSLGSLSICGSNWGDANAACLDICESDEDCGPGRYCFHYMECIVGASNSTNSTASPSPAMGTAMAATADPDAMVFDEELSSFQEYSAAQTSPGAAAPSPTVTTSSATTPNYVPSYIASLPVRPSEPTTFAPFILPVPTPNTLPNPNGNYCGYGYESANAECFHSCPSGLVSNIRFKVLNFASCPCEFLSRRSFLSYHIILVSMKKSNKGLRVPRRTDVSHVAQVHETRGRSGGIQRLWEGLGARLHVVRQTLLLWKRGRVSHGGDVLGGSGGVRG